jgi:hypothetical protein
MDGGTISGCLAKAKLAEHRTRDYAEALAWAEKALLLVRDSDPSLPKAEIEAREEALDRRIARLGKKLHMRDRLGSRGPSQP